MASEHGTRWRYEMGCRCDGCRGAQRDYQRRYRERRANGETRPSSVAQIQEPSSPGPVELATEVELAGLVAAESQPALAAAALAMARVLDHPRAHSSKPAAAKQLVMVLDVLHKGAARRPRGGLAAVRQMTGKDGA
jgi:hypothetical protein